jgi:hypothetical protein
VPGRDVLQAGFERDALADRADWRGPSRDRDGPGTESNAYTNRRGLERDRDGFGIEPSAYRDGRGLERDRDGFGIEPSAYRDGRGLERGRDGFGSESNAYTDRRGLARDRSGFGIEPSANRDGRGLERDRDGLGTESNAYTDRRGLARDRDGFGIEPSAYRDGRGPERDLGGPALEPNAYRDDGQGSAADRHIHLPSRISVEPRPSLDQRHTNDLGRPELERPDSQRPAQGDAWSRNSETPAEHDDDIETAPLPVILPGATSLPRPDPVAAPRGPFEPARPSQPSARPVSVTGSLGPPPAALAESVLPPPGPQVIAASAAAKLDQLKELYLTAEAIGEDALHKHFEQVSQRQQELIREFFERSNENDDVPS